MNTNNSVDIEFYARAESITNDILIRDFVTAHGPHVIVYEDNQVATYLCESVVVRPEISPQGSYWNK